MDRIDNFCFVVLKKQKVEVNLSNLVNKTTETSMGKLRNDVSLLVLLLKICATTKLYLFDICREERARTFRTNPAGLFSNERIDLPQYTEVNLQLCKTK